MTTPSLPTLEHEYALLHSGVRVLACADEAGRGALCGPVSVALVAITKSTPSPPAGVRDSKLLSEYQRMALFPKVQQWAPNAVGMASATEIDQIGIVPALRLAGHRALAQLPLKPDHVLLDGDRDYLAEPEQFALFGDIPSGVHVPTVSTLVKADLLCAGVAAASILAKTARDQYMKRLHQQYPQYDWEHNKGYGSAKHLAAIGELGTTPEHRTSFRVSAVG